MKKLFFAAVLFIPSAFAGEVLVSSTVARGGELNVTAHAYDMVRVQIGGMDKIQSMIVEQGMSCAVQNPATEFMSMNSVTQEVHIVSTTMGKPADTFCRVRLDFGTDQLFVNVTFVP